MVHRSWREKGTAGVILCAHSCGTGLLAFGMQTPGPHSAAVAQRVSGRLSPGPATSQWHQRLSCDACHGAHHRVRVSVDLFGLIRAQQSHGSWQTLQDMAVAMVLAHESCKRRVVCFPCGNCSRQGLFPEVCQVSEPSARSLLQVNVLIFLFSSLLPSPLFPGVWS